MGRRAAKIKPYCTPRCLAVFLCVFVWWLHADGAETGTLGVLVEKSGGVLYTQPGQAEGPAGTNQPLAFGGTLRTLESSRATVRFTDLTEFRLKEATAVTILPPPNASREPVLSLTEGAVYFFSRSGPKELLLRTPQGEGRARGTEFELLVGDRRTLVVMYDGVVDFTNAAGPLSVVKKEVGIFPDNGPPRLDRLETVNIVQWWLYYPAVLDPAELVFTTEERNVLGASLQAYRAGDLPQALRQYPDGRVPVSEAELVYRAQLLLNAGSVDRAGELLERAGPESAMARSVRTLLAAVTNGPPPAGTNRSASERMAWSYYLQSQHRLPEALEEARASVRQSPDFALGWERVAELEFGFGRLDRTAEALDRSLKLASRNAQAHALKGFVLSGQGSIEAAIAEFNVAIGLDGSLPDGWLGRGLCRIRRGETRLGREDLQTAVVLEPNRSLLHAYLGKALADGAKDSVAALEFERAEGLDPMDPTPWLYAALQKQEINDINPAVDDLQKSMDRNDNREVYRSRLLLDQDRAVRSANLAGIYNDAGLADVSVDEAGKAVMNDYANYSAHLFLANSFNNLRNPDLNDTRYETATFSEYLLGNLLSPVGGSKLSTYVSQQDYSRLFAQEGMGFSSDTTYLSSGVFAQQASQYGWYGDTSYALDLYYLSQNGQPGRANNDLQLSSAAFEVMQQLTPQDTVYLQAQSSYSDAGDVRQYYSASQADPNLRTTDQQVPDLFLGYHHEWSPGMHTLVLLGLLEDQSSFSTSNALSIPGVAVDNSGKIIGVVGPATFSTPVINRLQIQGKFTGYSAELQQIADGPEHSVVFGGRFQSGATQNSAEEIRTDNNPAYSTNVDFAAAQAEAGNFLQVGIYGYDQWHVFDPLWLTAGLSYDFLHYPFNPNNAPLANGERTSEQFSPKAGFVWNPATNTTLRGAFTRSLGGFSYGTSVRLEPVEIAGFDQAYRSLIPESVAGEIPGAQFQTFDLSFEHNFATRTYLVWQWELLQSDAKQNIGAFDLDMSPVPTRPYNTVAQLQQALAYQEQSMVLSLSQLAGREWSFGARYQVSDADLKTRFPGLPETFFPNAHADALLHTLDAFVIFNHPSGFFAEAQPLWRMQHNFDGDSGLAGDDFWQLNLLAGYRFPRRRAELTVGLLNVTGRDYHLNALNLHQELPHARTVDLDLKFNF